MHELNSTVKAGKSTCERQQKKADASSKCSRYLPGQNPPFCGDLGQFSFPLILVRSVFLTVQQFTQRRNNIFLFHCYFYSFQLCSPFHAAVFKTRAKIKFYHALIWNSLHFIFPLAHKIPPNTAPIGGCWVVLSLVQEKRVRKNHWLQSLNCIRTWNNHLTE